MSSCSKCSNGQYANRVGSSNCHDCPNGYSSQDDRHRCFKRQSSTTITPDHYGKDDQAEWAGSFEECPTGRFVNRYKIKTWYGADNTGLERIGLYCDDYSFLDSKFLDWGEWSVLKSCTSGRMVIGFRMQVCSWHVAATDLELKCGDIATHGQKQYLSASSWGWRSNALENGPCKWSSWEYCPVGYAVCGLKTKVEPHGGDDTAINDIYLKCCPFHNTLYHP